MAFLSQVQYLYNESPNRALIFCCNRPAHHGLPNYLEFMYKHHQPTMNASPRARAIVSRLCEGSALRFDASYQKRYQLETRRERSSNAAPLASPSVQFKDGLIQPLGFSVEILLKIYPVDRWTHTFYTEESDIQTPDWRLSFEQYY